MTTAADCRGLAIECLRWAEQANDAAQRDALIDIARLWKNVATEIAQPHASVIKQKKPG